MEIDDRLLRVGIEVSGQVNIYENLSITVTGTKFTNILAGECIVTIYNMAKSDRDYIVTETSPFNLNRTPKRIYVEVGRKSTGYTLFYIGDIFRSSLSQPPDVILTIRCLIAQFNKGDIVSRTSSPRTRLSEISRFVASDLKLPLIFEATDKVISNYSFTGSSANEIEKISEIGDIDAFIENNKLIVKDKNKPLRGRKKTVVNGNGIVGIPVLDEFGITATFLYDSQIVVGGEIQFNSTFNPALTGRYIIYRIDFNLTKGITLNPFYLTVKSRRILSG